MSKNNPLNEMYDWVSYDVAHFAIGRALGIFDKDYDETAHVGAMFYTQNVISDSLSRIAHELVRIGYIEYEQKGQLYRLNKDFDADALGAVLIT